MRYSRLQATLKYGLAFLFLLPSCSTSQESTSPSMPTVMMPTNGHATHNIERLQLAYEPDSMQKQGERPSKMPLPVLREPHSLKPTEIDSLYLQRYPTLVVKPNPLIDYKILEVHPNPNIEYSILEIDELGVLRRHPKAHETILRPPDVALPSPQDRTKEPEEESQNPESNAPEQKVPKHREDVQPSEPVR